MGELTQKELFNLLWKAAQKLRGNLEPSQYKYPVLGLIFLKYVSEAFEKKRLEIKQENENDPDLEEILNDHDEYREHNILFVREEFLWSNIITNKGISLGEQLTNAMRAIEEDNDKLEGALYKGFKADLDDNVLAQLMDEFESARASRSEGEQNLDDKLGQAYEYFLGQFALSEGKGAGAFYTTESIVKTIVEVLDPKPNDTIYEPAIGAGSMVAWAHKHAKTFYGEVNQMVYGQEFTRDTWNIARQNLVIRGIDCNLGHKPENTLLNPFHLDKKVDISMANPPFNQKDWGYEAVANDKRWKYGEPAKGTANFAWIQLIAHQLNENGKAGIVMANGAMTKAEDAHIRENMIKDDLIECMIELPDKMFVNTGIPACIFILNKNKKNKGKVLFIDAKQLGRMETRAWRVFDDEDIQKIADTYHNWSQSNLANGEYEDEAGFCKSVDSPDVEKQGFNLSPSLYVGTVEAEDDSEGFEKDMFKLTEKLSIQMAKSVDLDKKIRASLQGVGYEI